MFCWLSCRVGCLEVRGAVRAGLVAQRVSGPRALKPFALHVLEDEEQGRQALLTIDQLPLLAVLLHDHGLEVVRLVAALPDVVEEPASPHLAPAVAPLVVRHVEHASNVTHEPWFEVSFARGKSPFVSPYLALRDSMDIAVVRRRSHPRRTASSRVVHSASMRLESKMKRTTARPKSRAAWVRLVPGHRHEARSGTSPDSRTSRTPCPGSPRTPPPASATPAPARPPAPGPAARPSGSSTAAAPTP